MRERIDDVNKFRDFRFPSSQENGKKEAEQTSSQLKPVDLVFELTKYGIIAVVTLVVFCVSGPRSAICITVALYAIAYRFDSQLVAKYCVPARLSAKDFVIGEQEKIVSSPSAKLDEVNWKLISQIPGVDAERLKETFEYLYRRLDDGTLRVKQNGEWDPTQETVSHSDVVGTKLKTA